MSRVPDTIIPAAGASRRMGRWKPALPWRGGWIIDQVVETARSAGSRIIVVGNDDRLEQRFATTPGVAVVRNPDPERGMFSSIQCGMHEVGTGWCFVLPADMPRVPGWIFAALLDAANQPGPAATAADSAGEPEPPENAFRPVHLASPGHPVLLPPAVLRRALALPPDSTMRDALRGTTIVEVPVNDRGVCIDLDTEAEYHRAR